MNIDNILSFIYVYRLNSFHKAANALYVTQPSLSSRIQTLERDLGTQLIVRDRRQVELTEDGKIFMPYALQIVNAYTQAQKALQRGNEQIIIGANVSVSVAILPHVLRMFRQKHPGVSIEILSGLPGELLEAVLARKCSFAVTQQVPEIEHPDVVSVPVYKDPISLIVPPEHPFLHRELPPTVRETAMEPLIQNTLLVEPWSRIREHFHSQGVTPNIVMGVDSLEATKHMVLQGVGISFMPELSIEADLLERRLFAVHPEPRLEIYRQISLVHRRDEPPVYLDQFADLISRYGSA